MQYKSFDVTVSALSNDCMLNFIKEIYFSFPVTGFLLGGRPFYSSFHDRCTFPNWDFTPLPCTFSSPRDTLAEL